jgi:hypothetical protein
VHCDPLSVLYTWVCRMLSDRDVSKSRFFGLTPLNETAAAQVPVAPDHAVHARRSEHGARRSRGRAPGGGAPARPGPPRRGSRTLRRYRTARVARLAVARSPRAGLYPTQATPACQLSTIVQKTSTIPICSDEQRQRLISKPGSQSRSPGREPKRARSRACLTLLW